MRNLKLLSLFSIVYAFSSDAFADTISQNVWSLAINKHDSVAQYTVAHAYNPLVENKDLDCETNQFYLKSKNKKLEGCYDKSADKYIEFLTKAAENTSPSPLAQTDLGIAYIEGELVAKDIKKGLYWLEKAASPISDKAKLSLTEGNSKFDKQLMKNGVGLAQYVLGKLYHQGIEVKADYDKAIKYYEMASQSDDFGSYDAPQYQLYQLYKNKVNNPKMALYWLEQSLGNMKYNDEWDAATEIVDYFLDGGQIDGSKSEQPNYPWAAKWLIEFVKGRSLKDETRQKMAFQLAWLYLNGLGVERDPKEAATYYHLGMNINPDVNFDIQSSNEQTLQEQFLLNVIKPIYENIDNNQSIEYSAFFETIYPDKFKKIQAKLDYANNLYIENASKTVEAIFGDNLKDEQIFYAQLDKELQSYSDLEEFPHTSPLLALAQHRGIAYGFYRDAENLMGKSSNELIKLYQAALKIEPNNPIILYRFGTLYDFILQDTNTAISYYKQAADLGDAVANYRLGVIYYLGKNIEQNYHEAWRYLDLAAKQYYVPAQNFLITIDKSHPEFEWLTTQYIEHQQTYRSPTVMVDGEDWLKVQKENNPSPKVIYHLTKHNSDRNGLKTYEGCKAAIELATQGNTLAQKELVKQLNKDYFLCTPEQNLIFSWIDSIYRDDQYKQFLKLKYYKFTKTDEQYQKELNNLADNQNHYAIIELLNNTQRYYDSRDDKYLSKIKMLLKSGNVSAAELLIRYYTLDSYLNSDYHQIPNSIYQHTKAILLRNDLADYVSALPEQTYTEPKYIYADNMLSSSDIYQMWFELADMHEQGVDIPKNNIFAYVWYSLLVEHNQTQALNKVQELKAQLTAEQLTKTNDKLNQYRNLYRFLPLTHVELNQK